MRQSVEPDRTIRLLAVMISIIEQSVESNFASALVLCYFALWLLKNLALLCQTVRSKTKTNRDLLRIRIPALGGGYMCSHWVLIDSLVCLRLFHWAEWLVWFRFYDTQLKTALCTCKSLLITVVKSYMCPIDKELGRSFWILSCSWLDNHQNVCYR